MFDAAASGHFHRPKTEFVWATVTTFTVRSKDGYGGVPPTSPYTPPPFTQSDVLGSCLGLQEPLARTRAKRRASFIVP